MSFLGEIKRRKMFQVAAVYAVVAWLLVQIVATVEAPLNLPQWFDTAIIVLLAIGFPVAIVISWAFNVSPHGFVVDSNVETAARVDSRSIEYVLIALLAIAVGWLLYRDLGDSSGLADDDMSTTASESISEPEVYVLPNSIAVLLCDNFSTDEDDSFFAASLHEELLNQLFKLRNLNVIARTSVLQYSVTGVERPPIPEIARELQVASVMECSVAYGDDRIVISVQLIDGDTGLHIWSERYNREFENVFGIQADIAMNVANALYVEFSEEEQQAIERAPTESSEAYALYLRAMDVGRTGGGADVPVNLLQRALEFDPDFALAHYTLARRQISALINTNDSDAVGAEEVDERIRLAIEHADRARELDPSFAWMFTGSNNLFTWRWTEMQEDLAGAPDPLGQQAIWLYSYLGEHDEAIRRAERQIALNPLGNSELTLGVTLAYAGEFDRAADVFQRFAAGSNTTPLAHWWYAFVLISLDDIERATEELLIADSLMGENRVAAGLTDLVYGYSRVGRQDDANRIFEEMQAVSGQIDFGTGGWALAYLATGQRQAAIEQLELAIEKIRNYEVDPGFYNLVNLRMNVTRDPILEEPEFVRLREQLRGN